MTSTTRFLAALGALLITAASGLRGATINFTGNVLTDFMAGGAPPYVVVDDGESYVDLKATGGVGVEAIWLARGGVGNDVLYVGLQMVRPEVPDTQLLFGGNSTALGDPFFFMVGFDLDLNNTVDYLVGVPRLSSLNTPADPYRGFGLYHYVQTSSNPAHPDDSFGTLVSRPSSGTPALSFFWNPLSATPDFQFAIAGFSSFDSTAPFSFGVFLFADDENAQTLERYIPLTPVNVPEPSSVVFLVVGLGLLNGSRRRRVADGTP